MKGLGVNTAFNRGRVGTTSWRSMTEGREWTRSPRRRSSMLARTDKYTHACAEPRTSRLIMKYYGTIDRPPPPRLERALRASTRVCHASDLCSAALCPPPRTETGRKVRTRTSLKDDFFARPFQSLHRADPAPHASRNLFDGSSGSCSNTFKRCGRGGRQVIGD